MTKKITTGFLILIIVAVSLISCSSPEQEKPNILLIVVDTVRDDHLGYNGYFRNTSPNIDNFSREGIVFTNSYSQAGWTLPSFASIFTSLYPKDHHFTDWGMVLDSSLTTLAEVLRNNGYHTFAYPSLFYLDEVSGINKGFEFYRSKLTENKLMYGVTTSHLVNEMVVEDLKSLNSPFFMWVHYFDPHSLYLKHDEFDFGDENIDRYDSEIAYTDKYIGLLLDEFKKRGLYENLIIILTSDHGEEFHDHGRAHHYSLYQEVIKTPLIIKAPDLQHGRVEQNVEQIDLAPTILGLIGITVPEGFAGRDLLKNDLGQHTVFAERGGGEDAFQRAVIDSGYKLYEINIDYADTISPRFNTQDFLNNQTLLFDLKNDPHEKTDLFKKDAANATSLQEQFEDFYGTGYIPQTKSSILDSITTENLKALGYIQ